MPGIQEWMQASLRGWRESIYLWMLRVGRRASTRGCRLGDDAAGQPEGDGAVVAQFPEATLRVPGCTGVLHAAADRQFVERDVQGDDGVFDEGGRGRLPGPVRRR
jgi:hypothetical protein